ncbi:MAG TPA: hybrid sensor histidine kinase/response regulator [Aggregatilinea sp.]|uniref:hybrid sensor histidine kinase/response regulator n=1 Tax=Aggregatilinea sp. TaxID=2806333 RepID=UPI002CBD8B48|nr:hybrid sensor histidine kinase/response regulator [Aggregatilinea sp.]HML23601.1 hybrid sensor histidine kinase/response regulator [Aggregatilinea sp.]
MHLTTGYAAPIGRTAPEQSEMVLLVVTNDRRTLKTVKQTLDAEGYSMVAVRSAEQALVAVADCLPAALIVDARLPDMDGRQLCQAVKSDETVGFLPVILIGADDWDDESELGEDVALSAPVDADALARWLRRLLRIKHQADRTAQAAAEFANERRHVEAVKQQIISNVNHELGTPLLLMKLALSTLGADIEANGTDEQLRFMRMANTALGQLEGVTDNIRQLAVIDRGELEPMIVTEAIDIALRYIERSARWHSHAPRIYKQVERDLPPVMGAKLATARLLQLLLDNALKFSADDAPIYVHARLLEGGWAWVAVEDQGIGIPKEQQSAIFDTFYQLSGEANRRYPGTGTGLALALVLAQGMGTTIEVDSAPDRGSVFSFLLPTVDLDTL